MRAAVLTELGVPRPAQWPEPVAGPGQGGGPRRRAAVLTEVGVRGRAQWPEPVAGRGQAVVEVLAAGINPLDVLIAAGGFRHGPPPLPCVPGLEGVGLLAGRRVYFDAAVAPHGSMAERAVIAAGETVDVPDAIDDAAAVGLGIAGLAAWLALTWRAHLVAGEHVLVLAAGGMVGQLAVQAARLLGAGRVVAAARSATSLQLARDLGAD